MKLQIALDDVTLEGALELVKKVRDYIDIIEIGTPFVYEYSPYSCKDCIDFIQVHLHIIGCMYTDNRYSNKN